MDDEVDTVEAMVYYLYHGTYSAPATVKPAFADAEHFHFDVYVIGERYNVRGLCSLAFDNFLKYIRANWNDEDFGFIIGIIYTNQSERSPTLYQRARQAVVELAKEHAAELFALKPHYDHLQEVARITPEFMFDLLQELNGVRLDLLRLPDMGICSRANNKPCKNCKGWFGESEMKCGDDGDYFCLRCHRRLAYYSKVPAA